MANIKCCIVLLQLLALISVALAGAAITSTHLQLYMHETVAASPWSPATVVPVARGTTPLPGDPNTRFGDMYVIDGPLTEGPSATSPAVGRAQGFYLFVAQHELAAMHYLSLVFTAGRYNGSYIVIQAPSLPRSGSCRSSVGSAGSVAPLGMACSGCTPSTPPPKTPCSRSTFT